MRQTDRKKIHREERQAEGREEKERGDRQIEGRDRERERRAGRDLEERVSYEDRDGETGGELERREGNERAERQETAIKRKGGGDRQRATLPTLTFVTIPC